MVRYVRPVSRATATGTVAQIYEQMRREFGVHAEPIALHSPAPDVMAGVWSACRETLVAGGRVDRPSKEAVATTVSYLNRCPFCVDAHAVMLAATGNHRAARAIDRGQRDRIGDARLERLVEWAMATRRPGARELRDPPFDGDEAPELMGTAMLFHYINRPVSVFLEESPLPIQGRVLKGGLLRLAAWRFRPYANREPGPGASLALLPEAELPEDMRWAAGSPVIAGVWARLTQAVESAGAAALPEDARAAVTRALWAWSGEDPGLGTQWIDDALGELDASSRPAGRLALLAALAPYRVDEATITAYRDGRPDADVIGAVAWGALAAARRIGAWV